MVDSEPLVNGNGAVHESPYIKDLQRNIRNVSKKLTAMAKVDSIMAENPDLSLDQLVSAKKINNDQKAQALKKPSLQAQLSQLEEQITQYKKFEQEFTDRSKAERDELSAAHQKELEDLRSQIKPQAEEPKPEKAQDLRTPLLALSRFLRAAAARRQLEDDESEETKAFEGALLLLYGGDDAAVDAMEKLINGAEEGVTSTEGQMLSVTYSTIKKLTNEALGVVDEPAIEEVVEVQPEIQPEEVSQPMVNGADPTVAHAGLTEQEDVQAELTNGDATEEPQHNLEHGNIDAEAANKAAATQWDQETPASSDPISESWVSVPRDVTETENAPVAAAVNTTQSWADEAPPAPLEKPTPAAADDGFKEVNRRHQGGQRGGRGGQHDGRGGRGRGGFRGGRGRGGGGRGRGGQGAPAQA